MKNKFYSLWFVLICIVVFFLQLSIEGFTDIFLLNSNASFEPWRFVTAIFLHGSATHLLYNMFALALFGIFLEGLAGSRKFLFVFFVTGILANIISFYFYPDSLGASGAIYGVIGALMIIRPSLIVFAFGLPMPIFVAGILWAIGDVIGIFVPSNVANLAHLVGMFFGLFLGFLFRNNRKIRKENVFLDESNMRKWEDHYLK